MSDWVLGVIGGTGLYDIDGMENRSSRRISTPWGEPSDELMFGGGLAPGCGDAP